MAETLIQEREKPRLKLGERVKDNYFEIQIENKNQNPDTTPAKLTVRKPRNSQANFSEVDWSRI